MKVLPVLAAQEEKEKTYSASEEIIRNLKRCAPQEWVSNGDCTHRKAPKRLLKQPRHKNESKKENYAIEGDRRKSSLLCTL